MTFTTMSTNTHSCLSIRHLLQPHLLLPLPLLDQHLLPLLEPQSLLLPLEPQHQSPPQSLLLPLELLSLPPLPHLLPPQSPHLSLQMDLHPLHPSPHLLPPLMDLHLPHPSQHLLPPSMDPHPPPHPLPP